MRQFLSTLRENNIHLNLAGGELSVKYHKGKINKDLLEEIRLRKADLISYLSSLNEYDHTEIPAVKENDSYVLSSAQKRLWILSQFQEGNVAYNMAGVYVFEGTLNLAAFED